MENQFQGGPNYNITARISELNGDFEFVYCVCVQTNNTWPETVTDMQVYIRVLCMQTLEKVEKEGSYQAMLLKVPVRDKPHYSQVHKIACFEMDSVSEDRT